MGGCARQLALGGEVRRDHGLAVACNDRCGPVIALCTGKPEIQHLPVESAALCHFDPKRLRPVGDPLSDTP